MARFLSRWIFSISTRERGSDRYNLANRTDHGKAGGEPSALEVTCRLVARRYRPVQVPFGE